MNLRAQLRNFGENLGHGVTRTTAGAALWAAGAAARPSQSAYGGDSPLVELMNMVDTFLSMRLGTHPRTLSRAS